MKTSRLTYVLLAAAVIGVVVALAKAGANVDLGNLVGYGMVVGLIGLIAVEYGFAGARR